MFEQILRLLISTAADIFTLIAILRLLLQLVKADFYNPISQFIVRATDPFVRPLRRVIPGFGGIDFASLVLALLVQMLGWFLLLALAGAITVNPLAYLIFALFGTAKVVLNFYFFAIIILVILSWVAPGNYNPAAVLIAQLTDPLMAPFRRLLPSMGGLDLSPMLVLFVLHIANSILLPGIMQALVGGA